MWHHLAFGALATALLVRGGALDQPAGVVGLVLMVDHRASSSLVIGFAHRQDRA